jgi:putative FmdB family regulatory protein
MPIHEFECADCGHRAEVLMRRDAAAPAYEQCGSANVSRLLSAFRGRERLVFRSRPLRTVARRRTPFGVPARPLSRHWRLAPEC